MKTFDRAVRHGITKDGRAAYIMPSVHYTYMSDDDLGMLYSYISSLPPVDNEPPRSRLVPLAECWWPPGSSRPPGPN